MRLCKLRVGRSLICELFSHSPVLQGHVSFDISGTTRYVTARMESLVQITQLSKWLLKQSLNTSRVSHQAGAYLGLLISDTLGEFLFPPLPGWDLVHRLPLVAGNHL